MSSDDLTIIERIERLERMLGLRDVVVAPHPPYEFQDYGMVGYDPCAHCKGPCLNVACPKRAVITC